RADQVGPARPLPRVPVLGRAPVPGPGAERRRRERLRRHRPDEPAGHASDPGPEAARPDEEAGRRGESSLRRLPQPPGPGAGLPLGAARRRRAPDRPPARRRGRGRQEPLVQGGVPGDPRRGRTGRPEGSRPGRPRPHVDRLTRVTLPTEPIGSIPRPRALFDGIEAATLFASGRASIRTGGSRSTGGSCSRASAYWGGPLPSVPVTVPPVPYWST